MLWVVFLQQLIKQLLLIHLTLWYPIHKVSLNRWYQLTLTCRWPMLQPVDKGHLSHLTSTGEPVQQPMHSPLTFQNLRQPLHLGQEAKPCLDKVVMQLRIPSLGRQK